MLVAISQRYYENSICVSKVLSTVSSGSRHCSMVLIVFTVQSGPTASACVHHGKAGLLGHQLGDVGAGGTRLSSCGTDVAVFLPEGRGSSESTRSGIIATACGEREAAWGLSVVGSLGSFSETMLGEKSHGQLNSQGQKI